MRDFNIPFNTETEDKVIGGYISLRQFFWLAIPLVLTMLLFVANKGYITKTDTGNIVSIIGIVWRLLLIIPTLIFALIMAFMKKTDISADKYLFKMILYKSRKHTFRYRR